MPIVPSGFVNQTQIAGVVKRAIRKLGKKALRVNYTVGEDWSGDPAIYFRVVISDADSREEKLFQTTSEIREALDNEIRAYENWGLILYVSFRSQSEQLELNDPEWN